MTLFLLTLACGQDISVTETAKCDGVLQASEDWVDQPFDKDEDGYPDGGNTECQEAYDAADLDCDDNNVDINPSAVEVGCNLLDDDCNADTLDEEDRDEDSYTSCEECDDFNADVNPAGTEVTCNNLDDDCNPATADAIDLDQDGWSDCDLDCNDEDANINPGMVETLCNGVDDDCSETTPDGDDLDGDGITECTDCDDDDVLNFPGNAEVCEDEQDNDCDEQVDESCVLDYSGNWAMDNAVFEQCAWLNGGGYYAVDIQFDTIMVQHIDPDIKMTGFGEASQPGTMEGVLSAAAEFTVTSGISGGCNESYSITGTFTDANTMEGVFKASYSGNCSDCAGPPRETEFIGTR